MTLFQLFILALIQGVTEFLPISSSAHLILAPYVFGTEDQGALIDVMAHVGTLAAVLIYFRGDVAGVLAGLPDLVRGRTGGKARLPFLLLVATPPAVIAGGLIYAAGLHEVLRSPLVIAAATLVFALPLWLADRYGAEVKTSENQSWRDALMIGLAQMLAFIPGTSRSGITMTAARALGLTRRESARFSMLMSIPIIAALGAAACLQLLTGAGEAAGETAVRDAVLVAGLSFVSAYLAIAALMALVTRIGFLPFVIYRVVLAAIIIAVLVLSA